MINLEDDNKPLGIGDIYLGIDESTFNYKRAEFLANHPTLGNLTINTMDGEFEDGKLCCITINSTDRIIDLRNHYRNLNFYGWKKCMRTNIIQNHLVLFGNKCMGWKKWIM